MTFDEAYKALNPKQKEAVDTIDGPLMVVAGPGTGKTQLLATRAANILIKDSTLLPTNILCLTFSDSGAHLP
jgi:DNA helicase-2/ATP-dependent DNA helicase PcrA